MENCRSIVEEVLYRRGVSWEREDIRDVEMGDVGSFGFGVEGFNDLKVLGMMLNCIFFGFFYVVRWIFGVVACLFWLLSRVFDPFGRGVNAVSRGIRY